MNYINLSLEYLPFAFIGYFVSNNKKKCNILFLWIIINSSIVVFKLVFYNRFIIPLDLLFIKLAAVGLNYIFLNSEKVSGSFSITAVLLLFI